MILIAWTALFFMYQGRRYESHDLFREFGLTEEIIFLAPPSLASGYTAHLFIMLAVFFFLTGVAALNSRFGDSALAKLNELKSDKFSQILAFEHHPYIVFSQDLTKEDEKKPETNNNNISVDNHRFKVKYISEKCKKNIANMHDINKCQVLLYNEN